jgi:hypothetical protein
MKPDSPDAAARTTRIAVVHTLREKLVNSKPNEEAWREETDG